MADSNHRTEWQRTGGKTHRFVVTEDVPVEWTFAPLFVFWDGCRVISAAVPRGVTVINLPTPSTSAVHGMVSCDISGVLVG